MDAAETLLGSSAKVKVLRVLRASSDKPLGLSELARRTAAGKSTVRGAVRSLVRAGVVVDDAPSGAELALRLAPTRRRLVDEILALTGSADAPPAGTWAADDAAGNLLGWDADPHVLVRRLRDLETRPHGVWRVPEHAEQAGGAHGTA